MRNIIAKTFALLLVLVIMLSGSASAFAATATFEINGISDFIEFAGLCRLDSWSRGRKVSLNTDIDLSGYDFTGIPSFSGTFEGNGHSVINYLVDNAGDISGLFIYLEKGGSVNDLHVVGNIKSSSKACTGGLVAVNAGTVMNCSFKGSVVSAGLTGGIAGHNGSGGVISSCTNYAIVVSQENVGGIVGDNDGTVVSCTNIGDVNSTSAWVDESNGIPLAELANYEIDIDAGKNIGGIAGVNNGTVEDCTNAAVVGYLNSGENVGGITGYTDGKIIASVNEGSVFGKTNTGGIAGHMQPYIAEDSSEDLRPRINAIHDQTERMINDASYLGDTFDADVNELTDNIDAAVDTANDISREITTVVNDDSSAVNEAVDEVTSANTRLINALSRISSAASRIENTLNTAANRSSLPIVLTNADIDSIRQDVATIRSALNEVRSALQTLNNETEDFSLTTLSSNFLKNLDKLETQIDAVTASADKISNDLNANSKVVEQDVLDINDSVNALMNSALDTYEKFGDRFSSDDMYTDRSSKNPDYKKASQIRLCENFGPVKGQSNVGGIAGDSDVEVIKALQSDKLSVGKSYIVYALIDGCTNKGYVSAVKINAGGIVGCNSYGLIRNCLASGVIDSSYADYVGGITGFSNAEIRSSNSLAVLYGRKHVGGIAGDGNEIHDCLSLADINECEGESGAIEGSDLNHKESDITSYRAGMAKRMTNNYYCSPELFGIAGASYQGIAEPLSYDDICKKKNAPDEFRNLRLYFMDPDGCIINEKAVAYGETLYDIEYPMTSIGDSYVRWRGLDSDVVFGNIVLIAEQEDSISVLSSYEKRDNRSIALAMGEFTDLSVLSAKVSDLDTSSVSVQDAELRSYRLRINNADIGPSESTKMRIYCGDCMSGQVYLSTDGVWYEVPSEKIGRYLAFEMTGPEADVLVVSHQDILSRTNLLIPAAVMIAVIAIAVIAAVHNHKKKAKKKDENIGASENK